jgi:nicotinamide N-methyltransferase
MEERSDEEEVNGDFSLFNEPADFRPSTPPPSQVTYKLPIEPFAIINLALVGSHPLWAHHLWNAAPTLSNYLCQEKPQLCQNRSVLELGAAAGLPSIVASYLGAPIVVSTDYPDTQLIDNLEKNFNENFKEPKRSNCKVEGYIWGSNCTKLKAHLKAPKERFDLLLMSDLIFNHQAHGAMLDTMDSCLPPADSPSTGRTDATEGTNGPQALVFFTHHRPHLADKDMSFFQLAEQRGWMCKEVGTWKMPVSTLN